MSHSAQELPSEIFIEKRIKVTLRRVRRREQLLDLEETRR
jgi:hypothetical protein